MHSIFALDLCSHTAQHRSQWVWVHFFLFLSANYHPSNKENGRKIVIALFSLDFLDKIESFLFNFVKIFQFATPSLPSVPSNFQLGTSSCRNLFNYKNDTWLIWAITWMFPINMFISHTIHSKMCSFGEECMTKERGRETERESSTEQKKKKTKRKSCALLCYATLDDDFGALVMPTP